MWRRWMWAWLGLWVMVLPAWAGVFDPFDAEVVAADATHQVVRVGALQVELRKSFGPDETPRWKPHCRGGGVDLLVQQPGDDPAVLAAMCARLKTHAPRLSMWPVDPAPEAAPVRKSRKPVVPSVAPPKVKAKGGDVHITAAHLAGMALFGLLLSTVVLQRRPAVWVTGAVCVALAVSTRWTNGAPLMDVHQDVYRTWIAADKLQYLLEFTYPDSRHPPGFYFVLHAMAQWRLDPAWMRLPANLLSLLALGLTWGLARTATDASRAWIPAFGLACCTMFLIESRSVSDVSWFVALTLVSALVLHRWLEDGRRRWLVAYTLVTAMMLWSYYMAPVDIACQVMAVGWVARDRWRTLRKPLAVAVVLSLPPLWTWLRLVGASVSSPGAHGGGDVGSEPTLALDVLAEVLPVVPAWIAVPLLGFGMWRATQHEHGRFVWLAASITVFVAAALALLGGPFVRLEPHYFTFAAPAAWLVVAAALSPGRARAMDVVVCAVVGLAAYDLADRWPVTRTWETDARFVPMVAKVDGLHGDVVVHDVVTLQTIALAREPSLDVVSQVHEVPPGLVGFTLGPVRVLAPRAQSSAWHADLAIEPRDGRRRWVVRDLAYRQPELDAELLARCQLYEEVTTFVIYDCGAAD